MAPGALALCQEACHVLNCSAAMMELASLYLLHGDYAAIHRMESRLVAAAVEEGNVYCLADYCFMNATAYACLNQEAMTITYYERCIRLLQNTGWREILGDVHYNLGAMYISLRKYALCLDHLDQAEQIQGPSLPLVHKRAIALIRSGRREEALAALTQMEQLLHGPEVTEADRLKYQEACMECQEGYLDDPSYLELLERLIQVLKQDYHFGHLYFYRDCMLEACTRQRKYKRALEFEQEISSSIAKSGV